MTNSLYLINVFLLIILNLWPIWFSTKYLRLTTINPFTIKMVIELPVFLMIALVGPAFNITNGLFDEGYQFAVLMSNLEKFFQILGLIFFYRV